MIDEKKKERKMSYIIKLGGPNLSYKIAEAKKDGHNRVKIDMNSSDNYAEIIYELYSKFHKKPTIDNNGFIVCDIVETSEKLRTPSTVDEARDFLTPIFNDMLDSICSSGKYSIMINGRIFEIMKRYSWFDFDLEFHKRGYITCTVRDYVANHRCIKRILIDGENKQISEIYNKYSPNSVVTECMGRVTFTKYNIVMINRTKCKVIFTAGDIRNIELFRDFLNDMGITDFKYGEEGWIFKTYVFENIDIEVVLWITNNPKFMDTYQELITLTHQKVKEYY